VNIIQAWFELRKKGNKRHADWDKELKLSLFANDMIFSNVEKSQRFDPKKSPGTN
jgi:hypothetical protein